MAQEQAFSLAFEGSLPEELDVSAYLVDGPFGPAEEQPVSRPAVDEAVKTAVRKLLRFGGYKPSGRGRPASESLAKAVEDDRWPTIHPLVDSCNRLSLASGLPISVVDAGLLSPPLAIRLGHPGEEYVFNPSGQVLDVKGLLVLTDGQGPTGSPVKDAQRSKVSQGTERFLVVVWGTRAAEGATSLVCQGLEQWCGECQAPFRRVVVGR